MEGHTRKRGSRVDCRISEEDGWFKVDGAEASWLGINRKENSCPADGKLGTQTTVSKAGLGL